MYIRYLQIESVSSTKNFLFKLSTYPRTIHPFRRLSFLVRSVFLVVYVSVPVYVFFCITCPSLIHLFVLVLPIPSIRLLKLKIAFPSVLGNSKMCTLLMGPGGRSSSKVLTTVGVRTEFLPYLKGNGVLRRVGYGLSRPILEPVTRKLTGLRKRSCKGGRSR